MSKYTTLCLVVLSLLFVLVSCKSESEETVAPVAVPPAPVPVVEPVVEEPAEEPELPPIEEPVEEPAAKTSGPAPITRANLVGNYSCSITSKEFPMGITPPPASCRIVEGAGDALKIEPSGGMGVNGIIRNIKAKSFNISGVYNVGVGNLKLNATMSKRSAKVYKGNGKGSLGDDGTSIGFALTLKKK